MKRTGALLAGLLSAVLFFALITLAALEGQEVVVVRTRTPAGDTRQTRTWIADHDGFAWIEAANPERPFYRDILQHPEVDVARRGRVFHYRAIPSGGTQGHSFIRRLLAEKYGMADWWIGLLADTSRSIAIRLSPVFAPARGTSASPRRPPPPAHQSGSSPRPPSRADATPR